MAVDRERVEWLARELLISVGEDPDREGLLDTPKRYAKWWAEFMDHDAGATGTTFASANHDSVVAVTGMRVWSLCEHHLLPFSATLAIGYIPTDRILGLSKFARIAHRVAHRLQVQERMVNEIADEVQDATGSPNVAVIAAGEHLCMTMRGVRTYGSMRTSVMRGAFREQEDARNEFLMLVKE
jgi:GTP cyclohydrolase I